MNAPRKINGFGPFDAIVAGSGATGGVAAWKLTGLGLRVLVLDSGAATSKRDQTAGFLSNAPRALYRHLVSKRQAVQNHHPTYWASNPDFFIDDIKNPYSTPEGRPFRWIRGGRVGGRTLTWDAVTPRMSDYEFKAARYDGIGPEWPLSHAELAPHYGEMERFLGVFGSCDGVDTVPDGEFAGVKDLTPGEAFLRERLAQNLPHRRVLISRGLPAARNRSGGASASDKISSSGSTLAAAASTGLLTLRPDTVVSRVLMSEQGSRVVGVEAVDALTGQRQVLEAPIVFLCASTLGSVRILLNSHCRSHPYGVGGDSGVLGRYIMDHSAGNVYFTLPDVVQNRTQYEFSGAASIMVPRYVDARDPGPFRRGYGIWGAVQRMPVPDALRRNRRVAFGFLCARSEVLPHEDNRIEIDPDLRDHWGIPAPRIDCAFRGADLELAALARAETERMVEVAGGQVGAVSDHFYTPFVTGFIKSIQKEWTLSTPGMFVHEVGGARMGLDPKDSVTNSFGQVWGVENLYVTDGACWPTSGWQNPTLTEMAITARAAEQAARLRLGGPTDAESVPVAVPAPGTKL